MLFRSLPRAALLAALAAQGGCVGDFPAGSSTDATDARTLDRGGASEAGPADLGPDVDRGPLPDGATPDADHRDADADGHIFDVGFIDFDPNPEAGQPDAETDGLGPEDLGVPDLDLPDLGPPLLEGVADLYTLNGACIFAVGGSLGVLANDAAPPGVTVEVAEFDPGQGALTLGADGGIRLVPARATDVRFTYRWVDGERRSEPIPVLLRQRPGAIIVNEASDGLQAGLCSLRSAIRAANEDRVVQGCRAGQGADVIVFDQLATTTVFDNFNRQPGPGGGLALTVDRGEISIIGCGFARTIIDADGLDRVFDVGGEGRLLLYDATVRGGWSNTSGAGLRVGGSAELFRTVVEGNQVEGNQGGLGTRLVNGAFANVGGGGGGGGGAGIGGGVLVGVGATFRATGTADNCIFRNNLAVGGAGGAGIVAGQHPNGTGGRGGGSAGGPGGAPGDFPVGTLGGSGSGGGGGAAQATPGVGGPGGFAGGGGGGGARVVNDNAPAVGAVGGVGGFGGGRGGVGGCRGGGPGGGGAGIGGAIYNDRGSVTVTGCLFTGNRAVGGAAGAPAEACASNQPATPGASLAPSVFTRGAEGVTTLNGHTVEDGDGAVLRCTDLPGCL